MHIRLRLAAVLAAALAPAPLAAAPLTLEEIVQLRTVTAVELSPRGDRIAYLLSVPRVPYVDDDGLPRTELHVVDLEGNDRSFVSGDVRVREALWSSAGDRIYYLAERGDDENVALYEIPIDGGESRKLFEHATSIEGMRLSPDGRTLAFRAEREPPAADEALTKKGFKAVVYEESLRFSDVWLLDLAVAEPAAQRLELAGHPSALEWSPDGRRLVVALAPTALIDDSYVRRSLHVVDATSGQIERRIEHSGKLGEFSWSPDSTRIAFIGAADPNDPLEGRVYVASADGEAVTNLTPSYPGHVEQALWRDAGTLVYLAARGVWTELDTLAVDGSSLLPALQTDQPIIREFDMRRDVGPIAMIAETPRHPGEVYVWRDGSMQRLTRSNPVLDERDLAPQEPITYRTRDGLEIEGILVRPLAERRGGRHALVIAVHGGPESHYSNGWMTGYTFPAQALAADGYAVFYPNYRASTGRGVEFSKLDHGDPAGREFDDLVDAKQHLVDIGLADPERVGISGGSYGGYATMWGATALSEHFAAGVAFVGISDLIGSMGTSDIPHELHEVHLRAWPWDDWQFALERSPIYHAGQTRTPLLILGGDVDPRVDHSQSLALYRHIKLRTDTPVRLVQYPGEGHGNVRVAARLDYALRMKQWMDHYLVGPGGDPPPYDIGHAARLDAAQDDEG